MHNGSTLFESLFKREATEEDNRAFLEEVTGKHPYFTPAQFYLLQRMDPSQEAYALQAAKTSLLFNNPWWLQHQLQPVTAQPVVKQATYAMEETTLPEEDNNTEMAKPPQEDTAPSAPEAETAVAEKEPLLFEPMHLVDYFASQGIKLSEEAQTGDKLGKQLKSFTEWLKTMKKVHQEKAPEDNPQAEIAVKNLAEKSNTEDEIVTESMAEVFAMQGKTVKAIEIYEKLSLLNPSKSAFFAAKIEQLKG